MRGQRYRNSIDCPESQMFSNYVATSRDAYSEPIERL